MPRVGPGKEFVYGWVVLDGNGRLPLPPPVLADYGFSPGEPLVLLGGGAGPSGVSVCRLECLRSSALGIILERYPELLGEAGPVLVEGRSRYYGRLPCGPDQALLLTPAHLEAFGIPPSSRLAVLRESEIAVAFRCTGPLVSAAERIGELPVWE